MSSTIDGFESSIIHIDIGLGFIGPVDIGGNILSTPEHRGKAQINISPPYDWPKMQIESFPIRERKADILFTPADTDLAKLLKPRGFDIHSEPDLRLLYNEDSGDILFDPSREGNHGKVLRHKRYGKFYQDPNNKKVWHTKDIAGKDAHAGGHYKKYIQRGSKLYKEELIDTAGKSMNRTLGKKAKVIEMKDLIGKN